MRESLFILELHYIQVKELKPCQTRLILRFLWDLLGDVLDNLDPSIHPATLLKGVLD